MEGGDGVLERDAPAREIDRRQRGSEGHGKGPAEREHYTRAADGALFDREPEDVEAGHRGDDAEHPGQLDAGLWKGRERMSVGQSRDHSVAQRCAQAHDESDVAKPGEFAAQLVSLPGHQVADEHDDQEDRH